MSSQNRRVQSAGMVPVDAIIAIVVVAAIVGVGVFVIQHRQTPSTASTIPSVTAATSASIEQLTQGDAQAEQQADKNADTQSERDATSANSAVSNVGGAYNETTL